MKATLALLAFVLVVPASARAQDARLDLAFLDKLAEKASEKVKVDLPRDMLQAFVPAIQGNAPGSATARQVLADLQGIFVRSLEFDSDNAFSRDDVDAIRKQLTRPGWVSIVSVEEKDEVVEIRAFMRDGKSFGLAILAVEPRELTVVNIVGPFDLSKLGALGGQFGIPQGIPGLDRK